MKLFPVLQQGSRAYIAELELAGCPAAVPWSLVKPHEKQAQANHGQSLKRLAERGGLSPAELVHLLNGHGLNWSLSDVRAVPELLRLMKERK